MRPLLGVSFAALVALAPAPALAQVYYPPPVPYWIGAESDLRLAVTPREAMVYVDGYLAGVVDDFDGVFQRLHVMPGEHEITLYLQGYRTIRQRLYLSPNGSRKISETMEKLGAGEAMEPPPTPPVQAESDRTPQRDRPPFPGSRRPPQQPEPPDRDEPAPALPAPAPPPPAPRAAGQPARGGSLVLRVQPGDADILIDGELSRGPAGDERLVVQVSEGHHRVEVRKDGYVTFSSEVGVKAGESLPINVSLPRERR